MHFIGSVFLSPIQIIFLFSLSLFNTGIGTGYRNRIVNENRLRGSRAWWYPQTNETPPLLGFTTSFSYFPGEVAVFKTSSSAIYKQTSLQIYRAGYYNGDGARLIATVNVDAGGAAAQPPCTLEQESRMVDCSNWIDTSQWRIFDNCTSGVYFALPIAVNLNSSANTVGGYIPFVVQQSVRTHGSKILFKTSDTTWVAYNKYGGWNVYRGNGSFTFESRAFKASYNRPFLNRMLPPHGQFQNFLFGAEFALIYWLEQYGYDVSYTSCAGMEVLYESKKLTRSYFKAILSVGHDEYWSEMLKEAHYSAKDAGIHLAFLSGNEAYWQIHWDNDEDRLPLFARNNSFKAKSNTLRHHHPSSDGTTRSKPDRHRIFSCAKETLDNKASVSSRSQDWTGTFVDPRHRTPDPENALTGQLFLVNGFRNDSLRVLRADSGLRLWRDTAFYNSSSTTATTTIRGSSSTGSAGTDIAGIAKEAVREALVYDPAGAVAAATAGSASSKHQHHEYAGRGKGIATNTQTTAYTSAAGLLGYEWDVTVDDCYTPIGIFRLSHTPMKIEGQLAENYGQSYKGSGDVTHSISMYRHVSQASLLSSLDASTAAMADRQLKKNRCMQHYSSIFDMVSCLCCNSTGDTYTANTADVGLHGEDKSSYRSSLRGNNNTNNNGKRLLSETNKTCVDKDYMADSSLVSSLVFGAGTTQWVWGLSAFHDGPHVAPDAAIQQATFNLLADMGIFPFVASAHNNSRSKHAPGSDNSAIMLESSYEMNHDPWWLQSGNNASSGDGGSDFTSVGEDAATRESGSHHRPVKIQQQQQQPQMHYPSASRDVTPPRSHITHPALPHLHALCLPRAQQQQQQQHRRLESAGISADATDHAGPSSSSTSSMKQIKQTFTVFDAKRNLIVLRGTASDKYHQPPDDGDRHACDPAHMMSGRVSAVHVSFDLGLSWHAAGGRERWHYFHRVGSHVGSSSSATEVVSRQEYRYSPQHFHRRSGGVNSSSSSTTSNSSSVDAQVLHGTYNCDSDAVKVFKDKRYPGLAAQWSLLRVFQAALVDANVLYDEHRDYNQAPYRFSNVTASSSQRNKNTRHNNVLRLLMVIITQAVDDSGWVEAIAKGQEMSVICLLRRQLINLGWWVRLQPRGFEELGHAVAQQCEYCDTGYDARKDEMNNIRFMNVELLLE